MALSRSVRGLSAGAALAAVCLAITPWAGAGVPGLHHDLTARLEPAARDLVVEDTMAVHGGDVLEFTLARPFVVERVLVDGAPVTISPRPAPPQRNLWRLPLGGPGARHTITVRYRGRLDPLPVADHRDVLHGLPPMADSRGSFLPGGTGWYPEVGADAFTYRVSLDLPADQRGLVPGHLDEERVEGGRYRATFTFPHPAEGIDLIAGPYVVQESLVPRAGESPLRFRTYFHPEIADLAGDYLSAVGGYVDLYSRWIGPYPFTEFSVVSSPLPTGFGMPTLTYLGVDVLRLPFIRQTSLGHEILHNWWGNGVYVDFARGNWSEGLTAFMADYTYKEQEGADAARAARLELLRDIAAVPPGQDTPLREFTSRSHGTSQIVGYHKGTFLFLMLRDLLGTPTFDAGLRRFWNQEQFRRAAWSDLERAFEEVSGKYLGRFFDQWLSRRGAPRFRIETARAERTASGYQIRITLGQDTPTYAATIPVVVTTSTSRAEHRLYVAAGRQEFILEVPSRPSSVVLDPDFRVLRKLDPAEVPPILRQVMLDPATVTIPTGPDATVRAVAADLARRLLDHPRRMGGSGSLPGESPLLVIGLHTDVDAFLSRAGLPSRPAELLGRGSAQVWTRYQGNGKPMTVVSGASAEALRDLLRPLPHYGRQSYLIFDGSQVIERGVWPAQPTEWQFGEDRLPGAGGS